MEWVRNTIAENFGGPAEKLAAAENQFKLEETPDLSGKVAVVTGGSEGQLSLDFSNDNSANTMQVSAMASSTPSSSTTFPKSSFSQFPRK